MSPFERPPARIVRARRLPPPLRRPVRRRRLPIVAALALPLVALAVAVIVYISVVAITVRTGVARTTGTVTGLPLDASVRIIRDDRGVSHIRAATLHDLYFAQGYVTGSDRLFQIDVTRRYVYGRLSELLGSVTLAADERSRLFDPQRLVAAQFARLDPTQRGELQAYADGVNAAAVREPTPPEYRALIASFEPWRPQDSLACGIATVRDLSDGWDDVIVRDEVVRAVGPRAVAAFFPLTDPRYDTPTVGGPHAAIAPLPALDGGRFTAATAAAALALVGHVARNDAGARGSNAFAAGAAHTLTGRALLANDPHLDRSIPGIWHLLDLAAPGFHVAGATLAGTPGVILGHNERIAWGATNGTVAGPRVYREQFTTDAGDAYETEDGERRATAREERFAVRFGGVHTRRYLRTRHGFVVEESGRLRHAVAWDVVERPLSAFGAFDQLARARDVETAERALAGYPGPTQNFVLADADGRVGYALAGAIPNGPWGLRADDGATTAAAPLPLIGFDQLPRVRAARDAVVVTANNLQYGAGYAYRLSPEYSPPYRAAEIMRRLRAVPHYDIALFSAIQADTESVAEHELAMRAAAALRRSGADREAALLPAYTALASFDGRFTPESRGATVVERLRFAAAADLATAHLPPALAARFLATDARFVMLMRALRERPRGWFARDDPDAFLVTQVRALVQRFGTDGVATPYGEADAVTAKHPLSAFGFGVWNGPRIPGQGGRFSPAVQGAAAGQSFRAVWDVGNWDAGGIDIPLGESGEPGSPHYRDLADRYARRVMTPLPFSDAAVARAARATLVLAR
jgi:penicillin amidase